MKGMAEFSLEGGGSILVEVDETESKEGTVRVARGTDGITEKAQLTFEKSLSKIKPAAESLIASLRDLSYSPDEVGVEFGLKLNSKAGAIIASVGAEANFKVTLTWMRRE